MVTYFNYEPIIYFRILFILTNLEDKGAYILNIKQILKKYSMHILGIIAFGFIVIFGIIGLFQQKSDLLIYLPYGLLVFVINVIYLKILRLSRQDYEEKLKKEKEYSQRLLKFQKLFLRHAVHVTNNPLAVIIANLEFYELENGKKDTLANI